MPLYIFKKLFKDMMDEQLEKSIKNNIKLRTYNGHIYYAIRYMCSINQVQKFKKNALHIICSSGKWCQALLGMPDTAACQHN